MSETFRYPKSFFDEKSLIPGRFFCSMFFVSQMIIITNQMPFSCWLNNSLKCVFFFYTKATDLKQAIQPEFNPWLAQYLVMKRVSIEPNFHDLYSDFLKAVSLAELTKMVLDETYRNIKVKILLILWNDGSLYFFQSICLYSSVYI